MASERSSSLLAELGIPLSPTEIMQHIHNRYSQLAFGEALAAAGDCGHSSSWHTRGQTQQKPPSEADMTARIQELNEVGQAVFLRFLLKFDPLPPLPPSQPLVPFTPPMVSDAPTSLPDGVHHALVVQVHGHVA